MFYNVEFFFDKPYRFYTTELETENSVPKEIYDLYNSGNYIKVNGSPKEVVTVTTKNEVKIDDNTTELMMAIAGLSEEIELLKGEK